MTSPITAATEHATSAKVSIFARLVSALPFMIAAAGAASAAWYFRGVLWAMRNAETAGVAAVAGGIAEANLFVVVALYLAIVCGLIAMLVSVVRLMLTTETVSPSAWFFFASCALGLLPAALLWEAETILIGVFAHRLSIVESASLINWLTLLSMIAAPCSGLLLLAGSVWPLSTQSKRRWGPLVGLVAVELVLIVIAIAFHARTSWLYQAKLLERM